MSHNGAVLNFQLADVQGHYGGHILDICEFNYTCDLNQFAGTEEETQGLLLFAILPLKYDIDALK